MDAGRFDSLTRCLTLDLTRRRGLGLLATLGLSGLVSADPVAAKKKKKKPCPPCKKRKKGKCKGSLPDGVACVGGACQRGSCVAAVPLSPPPPPADPCAGCTGDQVCVGGACIVPACGAGGPCRVFLSSTRYTGALGGLNGADAKCQGLAEAAGLPGNYKAWLSDDTSAPFSRFVPSSGPYRLVNGTTIAANWTDLTDGNLLAPINVTETGGGSDLRLTWTHTDTDGTRDGALDEHCSNWSTTVGGAGADGDSQESDSDWTEFGLTICSFHRHLYCFQQN